MSNGVFVAFDCDGTLVDTLAVMEAGMRAAFEEESLELGEDVKMQRFIGLPLEEIIPRLISGLASSDITRVASCYRQHFIRLSADPAWQSQLFEGIEETLRELRSAGHVIGVVTGKSRAGLVHVLEASGISDLFDVLKTADDGPGKPDPTILKDAIREMGADPQLTMLIGDTSFDMKMAVRAGVVPLGVSWGYHDTQELWEAGAVAVVDNAREIPDQLKVLLNA